MFRFIFDLFFVATIALVAAYGLASVLREYTAVTWRQVLIVGMVVWILGTVTWRLVKRYLERGKTSSIP